MTELARHALLLARSQQAPSARFELAIHVFNRVGAASVRRNPRLHLLSFEVLNTQGQLHCGVPQWSRRHSPISAQPAKAASGAPLLLGILYLAILHQSWQHRSRYIPNPYPNCSFPSSMPNFTPTYLIKHPINDLIKLQVALVKSPGDGEVILLTPFLQLPRRTCRQPIIRACTNVVRLSLGLPFHIPLQLSSALSESALAIPNNPPKQAAKRSVSIWQPTTRTLITFRDARAGPALAEPPRNCTAQSSSKSYAAIICLLIGAMQASHYKSA
eukprot:scaffold59894_cov21-Prasinocladus_malaysianus.AAC.1